MSTNPLPGNPGRRPSAWRTPSGDASYGSGDFAQMDDSALLARRAEMRAELERLPPASRGHAALTSLYDKSTDEVNDRARQAWSRSSQGATQMNNAAAVISPLTTEAAKLAAIEILLTDPESLGDDVLESCLYLLRERLSAA